MLYTSPGQCVNTLQLSVTVGFTEVVPFWFSSSLWKQWNWDELVITVRREHNCTLPPTTSALQGWALKVQKAMCPQSISLSLVLGPPCLTQTGGVVEVRLGLLQGVWLVLQKYGHLLPYSSCNPSFIDYLIQFLLFARKLLYNLDVLMQHGDTYFLARRNKWVFSGFGFFPWKSAIWIE